jgi:hypothetical protein
VVLRQHGANDAAGLKQAKVGEFVVHDAVRLLHANRCDMNKSWGLKVTLHRLWLHTNPENRPVQKNYTNKSRKNFATHWSSPILPKLVKL